MIALPQDENFLGLPNEANYAYQSSKVVIQQAPYEYSSSYLQGSANGPQAIIKASHFVECYDEELDGEIVNKVGICTLPPMNFTDKINENAVTYIEQETEKLLNDDKFVVSLGAEHTVTYGFIKAFALEVIIPYLNAGMPLLPEITTELQNLFTAKNGSSIPSTGDKDLPVFFKTLERKYRNKLSTPKNKKTAATIADEELVATKEAKQAESENETTGSEDNSYKADNAGLVLLYPYLQMFFTELKLVKGEAFINKAAQIKAVQVLQYLSAGSLKTPEHLLALNKVICGIDMAMPVSARLRLTKEQKQGCDVLLNAVIANWPPLKNTSVEGFRQSFVQRSGSLKKDDKDWILHIERKGIDILLEQLPWSFSIMKLPWNEYLIHVQW